MLRFIAAAFVVAVPALVATAAAQQAETTGSRLAEGLSSRTVMSFASPGEVRRVLELLEEGRDDEAVALAESYLESLAMTRDADGLAATQKRYLALNAYCISLTRVERYDDAIARCTEATELVPGRWTAWNSRGAARYSRRDFAAALDDYRQALALAPPGEAGVTAAIEQNIRLAQGRLEAR